MNANGSDGCVVFTAMRSSVLCLRGKQFVNRVTIDTLLESRREDPKLLLLALGFGPRTERNDPLKRIPQRFLAGGSGAKGIDNFRAAINRVIAEENAKHGASSPTGAFGGREEILARFLSRTNYRKNCDANNNQNKPVPLPIRRQLQRTDSILNPANRLFLKKQGISENQDHTRKKLILGKRVYTFGVDGEPFVPEKSPSPIEPKSPNSGSATPTTDTLESAANKLRQNFLSPFLRKSKSPSPEPAISAQEATCTPPTATTSDATENSNETCQNDSIPTLPSPTFETLETILVPIHSNCNSLSEENNNELIRITNEKLWKESTMDANLLIGTQCLKFALELYKHHFLKLTQYCIDKRGNAMSQNVETDADMSNFDRIEQILSKIHSDVNNILDVLWHQLNEATVTLNADRTQFLQKIVALTKLLKMASINLIKLRIIAGSNFT